MASALASMDSKSRLEAAEMEVQCERKAARARGSSCRGDREFDERGRSGDKGGRRPILTSGKVPLEKTLL